MDRQRPTRFHSHPRPLQRPLPRPLQRPVQRRPLVGFTLIEVLLVLVILVVLGSFAASQFFGAQDQANINAAKTQISLFASNIDRYRLDCNVWPKALEDLVKKPSDNDTGERWAGPYLNKNKIPNDPWGNEFQYSADGKKNSGGVDIWSSGPDGQDGSDDDIGNWSL